MRQIFFYSFAWLFFVNACSSPQPLAQSSEYKNAAVVTAHPLASEVGLDVLKNGGNAIDAAIAVKFALAVVYPNAGNLGGGGFLVYRDKEGNVSSLDFREKAPLAAHRDMYLDENEDPITELSLFGSLSAGVPGSVAGMEAAHKRYGNLSWSTLIEPAIQLAENGFEITERQAQEFNRYKKSFVKYNPDGAPIIKNEEWQKKDVFVQKNLAQTLERIAQNGRDGFYKGETADLIVEEMKRGNGIITHQDLEEYKAVWREPILGDYKNYRIIS